MDKGRIIYNYFFPSSFAQNGLLIYFVCYTEICLKLFSLVKYCVIYFLWKLKLAECYLCLILFTQKQY